MHPGERLVWIEAYAKILKSAAERDVSPTRDDSDFEMPEEFLLLQRNAESISRGERLIAEALEQIVEMIEGVGKRMRKISAKLRAATHYARDYFGIKHRENVCRVAEKALNFVASVFIDEVSDWAYSIGCVWAKGQRFDIVPEDLCFNKNPLVTVREPEEEEEEEKHEESQADRA